MSNQGKKFDPWTIIISGLAIWGIMLLIAYCYMKAKADKNLQYQKAQVENIQKA